MESIIEQGKVCTADHSCCCGCLCVAPILGALAFAVSRSTSRYTSSLVFPAVLSPFVDLSADVRSRGGTVALWDSTTMAPANPPIVEPPPSSNRPQLHAPNREPHPIIAEAALGCVVGGISRGCGGR